MTRLRVAALAGVAVIAAGAFAYAAAPHRTHRLNVPPPPAAPRALSIDETEFVLNPSRTVVSAGTVRLNVYNRGMDDHDLVVYDQAGTELGKAILPPGGADQIVVKLPAGDYRVVCSLFAGTEIAHETLGMRFTLTVQDPPGIPAAPPPAH